MERVKAVVIGSGFGASVMATRVAAELRRRGNPGRVVMLERGDRLAKSVTDNKTLWKFGLDSQPPHMFLRTQGRGMAGGPLQVFLSRNFVVLHGRVFGGGSAVYGAVLPLISQEAFTKWGYPAELYPILQSKYAGPVTEMLGIEPTPREGFGPADLALGEVARRLGVGDTFRPTPVGVMHGKDRTDRRGIARTANRYLGGGFLGETADSPSGKNTLGLTYLPDFERDYGGEVHTGYRMVGLDPVTDDPAFNFRIFTERRRANGGWEPGETILTDLAIDGSGTIGTLTNLLRARDQKKMRFSELLGMGVTTNNESLIASTSLDRQHPDYSLGSTIASQFDIDGRNVQACRFPHSPHDASAMKAVYTFPLTGDGPVPWRAIKGIGNIVRHLPSYARYWLQPNWAARTVILLVMGTEQRSLRAVWGHDLFTGGRKGLVFKRTANSEYYRDPVAYRIAEELGEVMGPAIVMDSTASVGWNAPVTAHPGGGCRLGTDESNGVADWKTGGLFGHPRYLVVGNVTLGGPVGTNPSATSTAIAEHFAEQIPGLLD